MANSKNIDTLQSLDKGLNETAKAIEVGHPLKPDGTPITNPEELKQYYSELSNSGKDIKDLGQVVENSGDKEREIVQDLNTIKASKKMYFKISQNINEQLHPNEPGTENEVTNPDIQQGGSWHGGGGETEENADISLNTIKFNGPETVKEVLNTIGNPEKALEKFFDAFGRDNGLTQDIDDPSKVSSDSDAIKEPINDFFSTDDESLKNDAAQFLFDSVIPKENKIETEEPNKEKINNDQEVIAQIIKRTNDAIKKLAESHKQSTTGTFNLKKEAQSGTIQNVVTNLPDNQTDIIYNFPVSNWHFIERNKGFGLKLKGVYDIDWETQWQTNVMDKYTIPYKDKNGNWVGGYIEDRFDVDKNIPAYNNMQLPFGKKRRPTPPELGITQSRLESKRDNAKPFNWAKEASNINKTLEASDKKKSLIAENKPKDPFAPDPIKEPQRWCPICGAKMKKVFNLKGDNPNECPSCKALVNNPVFSDPQLGKSQLGVQESPKAKHIQINPNTMLSSIFYDGKKFICYSENNKSNTFDSFKEAENFRNKKKPIKKIKTDNDIEECDIPVSNNLTPEQIEKNKTFESLGVI